MITSTHDAAVAPPNADELVALLEQLVEPFASLWADHCGRLRQSVLEVFETEEAWAKLRGFIQTYGGTLFHARFMTLGNLRGILNRGIGAYLRFLEDNPDPIISDAYRQAHWRVPSQVCG